MTFSVDEPKRPYFDKRGLQLIEGSHSIIPSAPLAVGNARQLVMDKHVVDVTWNCFRTVHQPEKHPANPLIAAPESPTPFQTRLLAGQGTVMFDAGAQKFRYWCRSENLEDEAWAGRVVHIYYESQDGLHWEAPELGVVEYQGSTANNIIRGGGEYQYDDPCVVEAPARLASRGRFAMLYGASRKPPRPGQTHGMENRIAWSDDGIQWQDQPENPVFRGRNDTFCNMAYNPDRDVFMMYRRTTVNALEIRRIAYAESQDLVSWTQPRLVVDCDELDPAHLYGMSVSRYQGAYFGLLEMWYLGHTGYGGTYYPYRDGLMREKENKVDIQLAWSRDGIHWERHPERPIFMENGSRALGTGYDWGMIWPCQGIIEVGDRLHLYYRADSVLHRAMPGTWGNFCVATLRKDGFVSLDSPGNGYILTKPMRCPGGKLRVNVRANPGGFVRAAVRRGDGADDGKWLEGWDFDDGAPVSGDSVDAELRWKERDGYDALRGQAIRLHFWIYNAELYSFWFEK